MKPLVTVFMPVYNVEKYIRESLESILNQTYKNLEILIIDDGSTDLSSSIINEYNDRRIRLIHNEGNKGLPYTRNRGLKEATGKYLAIFDADDIAIQNRIEKQVEFLEKNKDVDVVSSNYIVFDDNKSQKIRYNLSHDEIKVMLLFADCICNPSAMIRLKTVKENNITYNEQCFVAQDYEFWTVISRIGKIVNMQEYLIKYRFGHENISKISQRDKKEKRKQVIDSIHNNSLDYYGFNLDINQKKLFNSFFVENNNYATDIKNIVDPLSNLINSIIRENEEKQIFNKKIFEKILNERVCSLVKDLPYNLFYKNILFLRLCKINFSISFLKEFLKLNVNTILRR